MAHGLHVWFPAIGNTKHSLRERTEEGRGTTHTQLKTYKVVKRNVYIYIYNVFATLYVFTYFLICQCSLC